VSVFQKKLRNLRNNMMERKHQQEFNQIMKIIMKIIIKKMNHFNPSILIVNKSSQFQLFLNIKDLEEEINSIQEDAL
jgi:hypothetical protein